MTFVPMSISPDSNDYKLKEWVEQASLGNHDAFEKIFLRFYGPLCKFAWRFLNSRHIAEEVVQDAFLSMWESRETLDSGQNIKSYLYQAVRNRALNYIKHEKVAERHNREITWINPEPATQIHSLDEESEFVRQVQQAISHLPEGARQIYKLSRKDGLTYQEIAEVLDISPKTVESQMSRALKMLRNTLSKFIPALIITVLTKVI